MSVHLVTGGAGFVAVTLIGRLLEAGDRVVAVDDLSRGRREYLSAFADHACFRFREADCNDVAMLGGIMVADGTIDHVWHLAANSDIPAGVADPRIDLERTFMTTFNVLQAMREHGVGHLLFASSSAIYGDLRDRAADEAAGPVEPISNYGAMKLASEAAIRAAVEAWMTRADIFRFPNVIGVPATHGVIIDLTRKLRRDPTVLDVLGDGTQRKPYLHVSELVDAMMFVRAHAGGRYNVVNIGPADDGVTVRAIAEAVRDRVAPEAGLQFGSGSRGWVGDVPRFRYSIERMRVMGWSPRWSSHEAVRRAVDEIAVQES